MKKIQTKADMDNFDTLLGFIDTCNECTGFEKKMVYKIRLACEEIIVNVIKYAYPKSKGDLAIECDVHHGKSITITFIDQGIPFNPLEKEEPDIDAPAHEREIGGLGIFIVKQIMDKIEYKRENGKNFFKIKKHLGEDHVR